MPKSIEHYQQESGRAGRDGLEAECVLLYGGNDYGIWKYFAGAMEPYAKRIALAKLNDMYNFCTGVACRHDAILRYFGQALGKSSCGACDVCLGELRGMDNALETAQKILSCVRRLRERFGADYTASVLAGSCQKRVLDLQHDRLSTYGLLSHCGKAAARNWIEQLVSQGYLQKTGEYGVLRITAKGWSVLKGEETPRLLEPAKMGRPVHEVSSIERDTWDGVDIGLFEQLRVLRREIAFSKNVPAFIVFSDLTLRDMARLRPSTPQTFLSVTGVGDAKVKQYGERFLKAIRDYCQVNSIPMDVLK
jgi:ATP-dependent DNA helicase RecQ